jgi:hypothetical protein|nr:MAG TPA: Head fiber protein [Caudoviricetes sp.]
MIKTVPYMLRADGVQLVRTYSTKAMYIQQSGTNILYTEAIDISPIPYTYTETDTPIPDVDPEPQYQSVEEKAEAFPHTVVPDTDYDALSDVTIDAPDNLEPVNIRKSIMIAGVQGTYEGEVTPAMLDTKVDKVEGKELSSNDYTDSDKAKLTGIDLSKYATTTALSTGLNGKVNKVTGKVLSSNDFTDALKTKLDGIDLSQYATTTALNGKVDKVTGKQLSTEDFTTALKTKLVGIDLTKKQDNIISATDIEVSSWTANAYGDYTYRATVPLAGCTADMIPAVVFDNEQADSGDYCNVCESIANGIYIWSKRNTAIKVLTAMAIPQ